ncbi:MAG: hypothetical protein ACTMKZ_03345 [Brevibacterium aurantiacum]|uniref:Uncharacterized protein n=1 Tax=Brevibacterium aurantiacum TaxID=273384 RepID=A0A2H1KQA9_BREAU|nr:MULTISPECIES: hypothetical protein [Brevibacterium]MDN5552097.1 hypothetical protein [Brevibacterium sp.]AOP51881.1 hypothetical protein BLSMQ_0159 [Brevibacterium aurantiacum]MDN5594921.1 hypothetical protein [Brevibacterium sp.]MDN5609212.1 hypothetical protein [Brevibacterium sp.]MDN5710998.1 hypothetical protein [Brevibacterium aurantiacum]
MSNSTPTAHVPPEGSPQSPVGGAYKAVGSTLTVVVVGGLLWGLSLTVIKAVAIFTG